MKKIILPLIFMIFGVGAGAGAGLLMTPDEPTEPDILASGPCGEVTQDVASTVQDVDEKGLPIAKEYAKLNNQFVVPIVTNGLVSAMVVLALSIEVSAGGKEAIYEAEPKLRDSFLQAMFDHANIGGFSGNFTSGENLRPLREELVRRAKTISPSIARDVLIIDIVRQDV